MITKMHIALIAVLICGVTPTVSAYGEESSANDLWAKALLIGYCPADWADHSADALFREAVTKTDEKDRVLVAYGKYCRSAHGAEEELKQYRRALRENPESTLAWQGVAMSRAANDRLRFRAISRCIDRDGDNGWHHYLAAIYEMNEKRFKNALVQVRRGNRKTCRVPRIPYPKDFTLRFPDSKPFRKAGLVGQTVSSAWIRYLADNGDTINIVATNSQLRHLAREISSKGRKLRKSEHEEQALACFEAVAEMGLRLIQGEPYDSLLQLTGIAIIDLVLADLRAIYRQDNRTDAIEKLNAYAKAQGQYLAALRDFCTDFREHRSDSDICQHFAKYKSLAQLMEQTGLYKAVAELVDQ